MPTPLQKKAALKAANLYERMGGDTGLSGRTKQQFYGYNEKTDGPLPGNDPYTRAIKSSRYKSPWTVGRPGKLAAALQLAEDTRQENKYRGRK
jgi:hypothetical protein